MKEKKELGEIGRREERREGRKKGRILMVMMMVVMMVMGCNSGGGIKEGEEGKARKGDGSVIDLKVIGEKIKSAVEFAQGVKEVETLVKSIDELAKAIGKKLKKADGTFENEVNDNNGQLVVVAYSVISDIDTKLTGLEQKVEISDELKGKIADVKAKSKLFLDKLKSDELCKKDAKDDDIKKAIERTNADKTKGAKELGDLNTAIDDLLSVANNAIGAAIKELTLPLKKTSTQAS
ncbi:Vsp/OspC family lipoprotein [Borrelia crocidurae]|uniref:Vsp protein n=1 Tax=Borrelia crocidurae (strain Achema) TaxID=1155096 RepID=I0FEM2_BORCA|nr:Vsp/OspC family lipoprotein [Borrelia crocidurae]AFI31928.1 Vsp protein [Borrelia crocidurae str. Achema]